MQSKFRFLLTSGITMLALPAAAQTTQEETQGGDEIVVSGKYTIPDRIDTATGLGLTVRETPQSVSIVTAQRIIDQNLTTVRDVIENGVGVAVNETDDVRNSFFARGFFRFIRSNPHPLQNLRRHADAGNFVVKKFGVSETDKRPNSGNNRNPHVFNFFQKIA